MQEVSYVVAFSFHRDSHCYVSYTLICDSNQNDHLIHLQNLIALPSFSNILSANFLQ